MNKADDEENDDDKSREGARAIARRILKPLFDRPVTPEQCRLCDVVTDLVERIPAEEWEWLDMPDVGREVIHLSPEAFDALQAALDSPPEPKPRLRRLMQG